MATMKPSRREDWERMVVYIVCERDPATRRFEFTSMLREDWSDFDVDLRRDGSPTRFAASVECWIQKAVGHYYARVAERWGAELLRDVVEVDELPWPGAPTKE